MKRLAIIGLLAAGLGLITQAATIQIGTGLDASGNPLAAYSVDNNYSVSGGGSSVALVYPAGLWPLNGTWVNNQPNGQWISPVDPTTPSTQPAGVTVNFSQEPNTMFTYTRVIPAGYNTISGMFSSDNPGALLVDGTLVAQSPGWSLYPVGTDTYDWSVWTKFFSASLTPGVANTITFEVYNLAGGAPGNPTGLIVEGTAVPDGSLTAMLLGMGLVGLGAIRRKLS